MIWNNMNNNVVIIEMDKKMKEIMKKTNEIMNEEERRKMRNEIWKIEEENDIK